MLHQMNIGLREISLKEISLSPIFIAYYYGNSSIKPN